MDLISAALIPAAMGFIVPEVSELTISVESNEASRRRPGARPTAGLNKVDFEESFEREQFEHAEREQHGSLAGEFERRDAAFEPGQQDDWRVDRNPGEDPRDQSSRIARDHAGD